MFLCYKPIFAQLYLYCYLLLVTCAFIVRGCPFSSYDEALISEIKPIEILDYDIPIIDYQMKDSIAFGFSSQCIPQWSPKIITYYGDRDYDENITEGGQQLLLILGDKELKIVCKMYLDWSLKKVIHQFEIYTNTLELYYQYQFQPIDYEGVWIFTFISFQISSSTISIESTGQQRIMISIPILDEKLKFVLGGRTFLTFQIQNEEGQYSTNIVNLNFFKGRISKLYISDPFIYDNNKFEEFLSLCQIPSKFQGEQTINLINGLKLFNDETQLKQSFLQIGPQFCFSGWLKYDFKYNINSGVLPILRVSTFKNQGNLNYEGDELLFLFLYTFIASDYNVSELFVTCNTHEMPQLGRIFYQPGTKSQLIYEFGIELLSEWHFLKYEYSVDSNEAHSNLQILFFDGYFYQKIFAGFQLTNSIYYITIGADANFYESFKGQLYGLKFQFNYEENKNFDVLLTCHYTCYSCNGPLEENCLSCSLDSNRKFLQEFQTCKCLIGYFDIGEIICVSFNNYFSQVVQQELDDNILQLKCQFGYFQFPLKNNTLICIQCPEIIQNQFYCVDCYLSQSTWYTKPICQFDIISQQINVGDAYQILKREQLNYNVYFIDETGIITFHQQYQNICDSSDQLNCFLSKESHLGSSVFVSCKPNYFYKNGECVFLSSSCLQVNSQGKCEKFINKVYEINDKFYECPFSCLNCVYNIEIQEVACLKCSEKYSLINDKCYQCGQFCKVCNQYYDVSIENSYLKCYKCIDDSKYFISFDAINCQQNTIKYCLHAFQSDINDMTKNTLDINFFQRLDTENIITHCARCTDIYTYYLFQDRICFLGVDSSCQMGYANELCDFPITDEFIETVLTNFYYSPDNGVHQYQYGILDLETSQYICTTFQHCLISETQTYDETVQFNEECPNFNQNCENCVKSQASTRWTQIPTSCLICKRGYYAERVTGKCYPCPNDLNCFSCFQQQIISQDHWKYYIRAFYKKFIDSDDKHSFIQYGQSENPEDYETLCDNCIEGHELYENKCIKSCPSNCLECNIIDNQNVCIKCQLDIEGRPLSVYNNECIQCPSNCALCSVRSKIDIYAINPLFNNLNLAYHSNFCFQSFKDKQYYYDQYFNSFIDCENFEKCQQSFYIELNLFCSKSEFETEYSKQINKYFQQQFLQTNILIDDLVSGNSFNQVIYANNQFENDEFFKIANKKQIRTIMIDIRSTKKQTCLINTDGLIQQQFSSNIFATVNVQLRLVSIEQISSLLFNKSITFKDFSKIEIAGFIIMPQQNSNLKSVSFNSVFSQIIHLNSITYSQYNFVQDQSQISFNNISELVLNNFQIKSLFLQNISPFLLVNQTNDIKIVTLQDFSILESSLINATLIQVLFFKEDEIILKNIIIKSKFTNSSFFQAKSETSKGTIQLQQVNIESQIVNSVVFDLVKFQKVNIDSFYIQLSFILNSTLCLINNNAKLNYIIIQNCSLQQKSLAITNSNQTSQIDIFYSMQNLVISDNQNGQDIKIFKFNRYNSQHSCIEIKQFKISNNFNNFTSQDFNIKSTTSTLFYFELDKISIDHLLILRGNGLSEITIVDAIKVEFFNSKIKQSEKSKFLGLHQFIDCFLQQANGKYYSESLRIYGSKYLLIDQLEILFVQTINFPIFLYNSVNVIDKQQTEIIIVQNILIQNCLIILTQTETDISIIKFYSEQNTALQFNNLTFQANILHEYVQDLLSPSALLIKIDSYQGKIQIINSQFINNTVFNSTDSITYINANKIMMVDCQFNSNNQFIFPIIQPYLLWGFPDTNIPYYEDLENIFSVKSFTGNGLLIIQQFILINCNIFNSIGSNGGGFMLQAKKSCIIKIFNLTCSSVSNTFNEEIETGGCFHIDSLSVSDLQLSLENIFVSHIHSRHSGGFIFLDTGSSIMNVNMTNITIFDAYSQQGSILYVKSSKQLTQQLTISAKQIFAKFTIDGIISYFDRYYLAKISESEQIKLINYMSLFYFENSQQIILEEIVIQTLLLQSFIIIENVQRFILLNFRLINSSISNNLITLQSDNTNMIFIMMKNIQIKNSQVGVQFKNFIFDQPLKNQHFQSFKCLTTTQLKVSSNQLLWRNLNQDKNFGRYLFMKLFQYLDLQSSNVIQILSLGDLAQVKIDNIEFSNVTCLYCQFGLLYYEFLDFTIIKDQRISNILIQNSNCGNLGCLNFIKTSNSSKRLLSSYEKFLASSNFDIIVRRFFCKSNIATFGTCLFINNLNMQLDNSMLYNNTAKNKGGAIFQLSKKDLIITKTEIINNSAIAGGGIYFDNQNEIDYQKLETIFQNNKASFQGNDISAVPSQLTIAFGESNNYQRTIRISDNQSKVTDQVLMYAEESKITSLMLPSGQKISEYNFFDWKKDQYIPFNKKFRLVPLNGLNDIMKNLSNSYCEIKSRCLNLSSDLSDLSEDTFQFTNNYTNIQQVYFDSTTQDYNLDDLIIYFDNETPNEIVLQLQFNCSSIVIPIYRQQIPYNIIGYHYNYQLNLNVKSYACQYGEIKNKTNYSCQICDSLQGQFQLKLHQEKCEIKDDVSTISVNSAQLNLRSGYWRPFFNSPIVTYCLNLPINCLGGWNEGNPSCVRGHVGALCEQCDLYNIRGDGRFSVSYKYSCGSCLENNRNAVIISFVSLWTFASIIISVYSTLKVFEQHVKIHHIKQLGLAINYDVNQSGILIKILTNYFQIISSLSTFQLSFSIEVNTAINTFGSPIQTMIYSLDCFLAKIFSFQIHYARMIWQLIMPIIYINIFFLVYFFAIRTQIITYNKSVVSTTLIYMYIYLQPSLIGGLVELLSFRDISGYKWILANVSYLYDSPIHLEWMVKFCFPILLLLAFLIPLYFFYGLYSNSNYLNDKACRLKWGYLYNEYKPQAYFWDIVKIVQKELMIIILTYYTENVIMKASILIFILVVYLDFNLNYTPYFSITLNQLDYFATTICIKSIVLALGIYIAKISDIIEIRIIGLFILFFLNIRFIIFMILKILKEYFNSKSSFFDSKLDMISEFLNKKFHKLNRYHFMRKFLQNRTEQKKKMNRLFQKLKIFLLYQAREIIIFKQYQEQRQLENQFYNQENYPSSSRSSVLLERQQFFTKSIRESLNQSKTMIPAQVLQRIKSKQIALFEDKEIKNTKLFTTSQSAKFIQDQKNEEYDN